MTKERGTNVVITPSLVTLLTGPSNPLFKASMPLLNALQHDHFRIDSSIDSYVVACRRLEDGTDPEPYECLVFINVGIMWLWSLLL